MSGGLIQIVTYGAQDLYLTGTPEITFFKVVYRRHTNFSMESLRVDFDDSVGFGCTSALTVPRVGDLIHKAYLEVILPAVDFKRRTQQERNNETGSSFRDIQNAQEELNIAEADYEIIRAFMSINRRAYRGAFEEFQASNISDSQKLVEAIDSVFNDVNNVTIIEDFKDLLLTAPNRPVNPLLPLYTFDEISMQSIADSIPIAEEKTVFLSAMNVGIDKSARTQKFFFDIVIEKREALNDAEDDNIKFAWVERIGHAIIDEIEVRIGGNKIDRHYGDWLNIWYELTANRDMEEIYFKMIGNVEALTSFDRNAKPKYKLKIPLQFWFCRHSGLSIPLVSLEYHEVTFHVKFRKFEDVAYIEEGQLIVASEGTNDKLFLDEASAELGINIEAGIFFDYIYLDSKERRRFAQSSHEYLIDQLQILEIRDINQPTLQCVLNNFVHPSKELIWVAQKERYTENINGSTQTRFDNYSLTDENKGNIIAFSSMDFHSYSRVIRQEAKYFNYLQPYETHNTTPSDGINLYSFSLFPEENQPTGTANLSRLARVVLFLEFDPALFPEEEDPEQLIVRIYSRNLNILRFISGLAGPAWAYG